MILAKRVLVYFDKNWESSGFTSIALMPGTMIPIPGLSPEPELAFRGYNAITIHWHKYALTVSFKRMPQFDFHHFSL